MTSVKGHCSGLNLFMISCRLKLEHILTAEGPAHATKPENDSQRFQRLCSGKQKRAKFRVLAKRNLSFRYNELTLNNQRFVIVINR